MTTNIDSQLQEIAQLRETKSKEIETLAKITELESAVSADFTVLAKLNWEKAFVYQHLVMSQIDIDQNLKLMAESALKAHGIVEQNNLTELQGDDFRFLGRVYDYKKDYSQAEKYYQQALGYFQNQNDPRVLEIKGFMSANLINQGKIEPGLTLAKKTYSEFDQTPLKQSDFYTWAVWKTGIFPRVVKALIVQKVDFNKPEMKQFLETDQKLLLESDKNFQYRLDEIAETLKQLFI